MAFTNGKLVTDAVAAEKQPLDGDLTTIAGLTATTDSFIQAKSSAWAARTIAQVKTDLGLTGTNSGDQTITLTGVVTGSGTGSFATSFAADPVFSGSIYLGTATNVSGVGAAGFQVQGVGTAGNATIARFSNNITGPILSFAKSRAAAINTYTILTAGDIMGNLEFYGADGSTEILGARLQVFNFGTPAAGDVRAGFRFATGSGPGAVTVRLAIDATTITASLPITSTGSILSLGTGGVGYGSGAGGTVTQATNKATGVTLNKASGRITTNAAALAAGASVEFTLTNSEIGVEDVVGVNVQSPVSKYTVTVVGTTAGTCILRLTNYTGGSLSEAVLINFAVMKVAIT